MTVVRRAILDWLGGQGRVSHPRADHRHRQPQSARVHVHRAQYVPSLRPCPTRCSRLTSPRLSHTASAEDGNATYIIPRPHPTGDGRFTTILGGKYQKDNWDTSFSAADAEGILARCAALAPALLDPATRVLAHNVGLRPARRGGPRIEAGRVGVPMPAREWLASDVDAGAKCAEGEVLLVHAYGFGWVHL